MLRFAQSVCVFFTRIGIVILSEAKDPCNARSLLKVSRHSHDALMRRSTNAWTLLESLPAAPGCFAPLSMTIQKTLLGMTIITACY